MPHSASVEKSFRILVVAMGIPKLLQALKSKAEANLQPYKDARSGLLFATVFAVVRAVKAPVAVMISVVEDVFAAVVAETVLGALIRHAVAAIVPHLAAVIPYVI